MSDNVFHFDGSNDLSAWCGDISLIRLGVDHELSGDDVERYERLISSNPAMSERATFEQRLWASTGRVMGSVAVPVGLADRVLAAVASEEAMGESLDALGSHTRQRSFWSRPVIRSVAAAAFVIGLSAVLIFQATGLSSVPLDAGQMAYRQQLAGFLTERHDQFSDDIAKDAFETELGDSGSFEAFMTTNFGRKVDVPEPAGDVKSVRFAGGGPCHVPGNGPSGHGVYRADFAPEISVFVKPDHGELPLKPGRTYSLKTKECGLEGTRILALVKDGVIYYFVFNEGPGCQKMLELLGVKPPSSEF